jgi:hypothetical protein
MAMRPAKAWAQTWPCIPVPQATRPAHSSFGSRAQQPARGQGSMRARFGINEHVSGADGEEPLVLQPRVSLQGRHHRHAAHPPGKSTWMAAMCGGPSGRGVMARLHELCQVRSELHDLRIRKIQP